jgi:rfaE bifunctional protein nucleotidyltransferase chain/domain/rfaE bifunctional protein kinase chain/domain
MTGLVVVGDSLLDRDVLGRVDRICPDAPVPVVDAIEQIDRPGGAAFAASLLAADGADVTLVTALGDDEPGEMLRRLLTDRGVRVLDVGLSGATPEKIRVRAAGQSLLRLDRGGVVGAVGALDQRAARLLADAGAVLVSDYGRGMAAAPWVRDALVRLPDRVPLVWDPHPRGPEPVHGASLVTPNDAEAMARAVAHRGTTMAAVATRARALVQRWNAGGVAVTLGARGALLVRPSGPPLAVPAPVVEGGDPCGAGDCFAGAALRALAAGAILPEAIEVAVAAASAFVGAGGATGAGRPPATAEAASPDPERRAGDTIVATGGCFDLLHAGHVATLQAARRLGDRLVVLLNSDASVRRLKGPDRPIQSAADRARILAAVSAVDEVVIFDEDTPIRALEQLRPDIWVKGADYAVGDLPETEVLARWGGQALVVPYLDGRSTTRLVKEVSHHVRT